MRLLYRLLFIFYAESRKLLNTDNRRYREISLKKLKKRLQRSWIRGELLWRSGPPTGRGCGIYSG